MHLSTQQIGLYFTSNFKLKYKYRRIEIKIPFSYFISFFHIFSKSYERRKDLTETKCECTGRYTSMKKGAEIYKNTKPERERHNTPKKFTLSKH